MHSDKEPVQPTRFDAAQPAVAADLQVAPLDKHTAGLRWILPALIVLVLMLLAVIFWLPGQVSPPSSAGPDGQETVRTSPPRISEISVLVPISNNKVAPFNPRVSSASNAAT